MRSAEGQAGQVGTTRRAARKPARSLSAPATSAAPARSVRRVVARELAAALAGSTGSLAVVITLGVLAYGAAGGPAVGIPAGFAAIAIGGLVVAFLQRSPVPAAGPSSATALILAGLVGQLAHDPLLVGGPDALARLVALAGGAVALGGLVQVVFGALRFGSMARYVPQPVLAGFMNGIALLILVAQVPVLLGIPGATWRDDPLAALAHAQPATLAIGLATAAVVWAVAARSKRVPSSLAGLAAGCLLYALVHAMLPDVPLGPLASATARLPLPDALAPLFEPGSDLLARHARDVALAALVLALVGSLESILNRLAVDQQLHATGDPNRDLVVFGVANVVSGAFGGLWLVYLRLRAAVTIAAGGRTRWSSVAGCLMLAIAYLAGARAMNLLPLAVLGGVMVTIAFGLADRWTARLLARWVKGAARARDVRSSLAVVAAVCAVTVAFGFVAGVAVGMLLSVVAFIRAMNRSLVRTRTTAAARPSRRVYGPVQEEVLRGARGRIAVVELEGALFFGSASHLADELAALGRPTHLVLDFNRVTNLDPSGATALAHIALRLAAHGTKLALSGVSIDNRHGETLEAFQAPGTPPVAWFADVDRAVEAAERDALAEAGVPVESAAVGVESSLLLSGLDACQLARVRSRMRIIRLAAGEWLFREGDPGDALYVLEAGSISIVAGAGGLGTAGKRFASFSPGILFGELAVLDGGGRTAGAIADVETVVHELRRDDLDALRGSDPELASRLYANIARHLSRQLRATNNAWRADAG